MSGTRTNKDLDGPRPARPGELDGVLNLADEVMRVEQGHAPSIAVDYPFIYNDDNLENIVVVTDGALVVATVAIWVNEIEVGAARLSVGGINCLATRTGYRGRGLATTVMRGAQARMAELGCHVGRLTTNIAKWYRRLGWENAAVQYDIQLNHSNVEMFAPLPGDVTYACHDDPFDDDVLDAVVALRRADRLGGVRTAGLMRTLLGSGSDPDVAAGPRIVVARRGSDPVSYLIDRGGSITEWGGSADLVAGLLRAWFLAEARRRTGDIEIDAKTRVPLSEIMGVIAPRAGHGFIEGLRPRSLPVNREYWGMLYVVDPRGILDAFGLDDVDLAEADGLYTLTRGGATVTVDRPRLAKLLFGPERIDEFAADRLPLVFYEWPLEHV